MLILEEKFNELPWLRDGFVNRGMLLKFMKSEIISLMESVKLKPITFGEAVKKSGLDLANDVAFHNAYNDAIADQKAKIAEELKRRGIN